MEAGVVDAMTRGFEELPLTQDAIDFARSRHEGQRRDADDAPFVVHPLEVAILLRDAGYPDHVVATGALHEVLEDTDVDKDELEERFGPEVAELVGDLTDDPSIEDQQERRAALRRQVAESGERTAAVFAADKVSKARELRMKADRGPLDEESQAKLEHYVRSLEMLERALPGSELVSRLREELGALDAV
ncbi:MAG TPA: HD domain-containing protein [Thermoleophilaceae bacterium]|nr:HD domain-containing protein [Thermoleophilaceae bacterium]